MFRDIVASIVACCALAASSHAASMLISPRAQADRTTGDGSRKILVCHNSPRNPDVFETITVSVRTLRDHLAHGDSIGSCDLNCKLFPQNCDDGDPCTTDVCDPLTKRCLDSIPKRCNDDDACTQDRCAEGVCKHEPVVCPDWDSDGGGLCRQVGCDKTLGCVTLEVDCGSPCKQCNPATGDCELACCGSFVVRQGHTLAGAAQAEAAIAAAQVGNTLTSDVDFTLVYDGDLVDVHISAGSFASPADLAAHIQAAIDEGLEDAGVGEPGDIMFTDC